MTDHQDLGPTSTLARGLMVLEMVARYEDGKGVSLQDVVRTLGLHRSNAYRYLTTLCEDGWLERDELTYRYRVGWKTLQVAGTSLQRLDLRKVARPFIEELALETCLAVHLAVLNGDSIVYLDKVESDSPIQMRSRPGMSAPGYCTSVGKAMLAYLPTADVRARLHLPLTPRTRHTITDVDELIDHLASVRQRGYALDLEENEQDIGCMGAAVFNFEDQMIGGISVSMFYSQLTSERINALGPKLMDTARKISQSMGCHTDHWFGPSEPASLDRMTERKEAM